MRRFSHHPGGRRQCRNLSNLRGGCAAAIGDGLDELGRQLSAGDERESSPWESITGVLQRTADEAIEPYTTRFRYLMDIFGADD